MCFSSLTVWLVRVKSYNNKVILHACSQTVVVVQRELDDQKKITVVRKEGFFMTLCIDIGAFLTRSA